MRRSVLLGLAVLLTATPVLQAAPAHAVQAPVAFAADAQPTWQTDGIAWSVAAAGGKVVVGGAFSAVRPPGAAPGGTQTPRRNLVVLDAATGALDPCAPSVTFPDPAQALVRSLVASPDGRTVYLGGTFTEVAGVPAPYLAALDLATCTVVPTFTPRPDGPVRALAVDAGRVLLGGLFTRVQGEPRARVASVAAAGSASPGALQSWAPSFDGEVLALGVRPDGGQVAVGGRFDTVGTTPSHALAVVDGTTGAAVRTYPDGFVPARSVVKDIAVDETGFYTANEGTGLGVFDGRIALDWSTGAQRWRDTCLGATQAVAVHRGVLYSGSHAHDCTSMNAFPDGPRRHLLAQSTTDPALLSFFPDTDDGIGEQVGPRDLTVTPSTAGDQLYVVGEFRTVNGAPAQGITRFGTGPDANAPDAPVLSVSSPRSGEARVTWLRSVDLDDRDLEYSLYRDGGSTPIHTLTAPSTPWTRDQLTYTDTGLTPGSSHTYRVVVRAPGGSAASATRAVIVASTSSAYRTRVLADAPDFLWRYDELSDVLKADDSSNERAGVLLGGGAFQVRPSALGSSDSTAYALSPGTTVYSARRARVGSAFSLETWIRTTTTRGGKILGFGNRQTGLSANYDRHLYMTDQGRLAFGVYDGQTSTVMSPMAYNDGGWHHVVATMSPSGTALYVDGARVGQGTATQAEAYDGFWRLGGDQLAGWPEAPTSNYWEGAVDETAVYPTALSGSTVAAHYGLATDAPVTVASPVASDSYTATVRADDPVLAWRLHELDGSTARDSSGAGRDGSYGAGALQGRPGALAASADPAVTVNGSTGGTVSTLATVPNSTAHSQEVWLRTTTTRGGKVMGFGTARTGSSSSYDKHVYMTDDGRLVFGVYTGRTEVASSASAYNDGTWHHVVATQDASGMRLYVDGRLVASGTTSASESYAGFWRLGGDTLAGWPSAPTSAYIAADLDEAALYRTALSAARVQAHHDAGRGTSGTQDSTPPSAPEPVSASVASGDVALSWPVATDDTGTVGYEVHRSSSQTAAATESTRIASPSATSYVDRAVAPGTWYYRVVARDAAGNRSAATQPVSAVVTDTTAPGAPSGLAASASAASISLSWTARPEAEGVVEHVVHRSRTSGFSPSASTRLAATTGTSYLDTTATSGTWYYVVVARDAAGNTSAPSQQASATLADTSAPSAPASLTATASSGSIALSWPAATDDVAVVGYEVHRSSTSTATVSGSPVLSTSATSATDVPPSAGTWYYRVTSRDAAGNRSAGSPEASATTTTTSGSATSTVTVTASEDTYANSGAPATRFGSEASLASAGSPAAITYLKFPLPTAPAGTTLKSVSLRLATNSLSFAGSSQAYTVRPVAGAWSEATLTWQDRPEVGTTSLGVLAAGSTKSTRYEVPLTAAALANQLGTTAGLAVTGAGDDDLWLWSRDHPSSSVRPRLTLVFG